LEKSDKGAILTQVSAFIKERQPDTGDQHMTIEANHKKVKCTDDSANYSIDYQTGQLLWKKKLEDQDELVAPEIVVSKKRIAVSSITGNTVLLLDKKGCIKNRLFHDYEEEGPFQINSYLLLDRFNVIVTGVRGSQKNIRVTNLDTGAIRYIEGHQNSVFGLEIRATGSSYLLLSASADGTARVFGFESGKCLHVLRDHTDHIKNARFIDDD